MRPLIHFVWDYESGDLAPGEIVTRLCRFLPPYVHFHETAIAAYDTIGSGFCLAQLALVPPDERPDEYWVFGNCAPRKDLLDVRVNNAGEGLLLARLNNGVPVLAVNSGYSFSFLKESIVELWTVQVEIDGSQFRSRKFFPKAIAKLLQGDFAGLLASQLDPQAVIPDYPRGVVGYTDHPFKNLKTTYRTSDPQLYGLEPGQKVLITINNISIEAQVALGMFGVRHKSFGFVPGSSGYEDEFWEVILRGGHASDHFGNPESGTPVVIERI